MHIAHTWEPIWALVAELLGTISNVPFTTGVFGELTECVPTSLTALAVSMFIIYIKSKIQSIVSLYIIVPPSTKIKKWISKEANGYIFVWYSAEASELPWDIPASEEVENKSIVYLGRNEFHVRCHIQEIPENGADLAHFRAIHNDNIITGTSDQKHSIFSWLGYHQWQARY